MANASKGNGEEKMCFQIPLTISNIFVLYQRAGSIPIKKEKYYGAKRTRTADPLHAMQVLYQLSYGPIDNYNNSSIHESLQVWC